MQPKVSVYITTYFHEKYIEQAIESVLRQKTNFSIQIVISDDSSSDRTPEIIKEYSKKYKFIKFNINKKNIGLTANVNLARNLCEGYYISELSGDDYWIDEYKLQKQVDFLEANSEYFAVCNNFEIRYDFEIKPTKINQIKQHYNIEFTLDMFLKGNNLPMNGILFKNPFKNKINYEFFSIMPKISKYIDDLTDNILFLMHGKIFVMNDVMVVYRVRKKIKSDNNFNTVNKGLDSFRKHIEVLNKIEEIFDNKIDLYHRYKMLIFSGFFKSLRSKRLKEFIKITKTIPKRYNKIMILFSCMAMIPRKIYSFFLSKLLFRKK